MQITTRIIATLAFFVFALSAAAAAQSTPAKLPTGTWTGSVTPPGQEQVAVSFDVAAQNDTFSITINAGGHGTFKADGIKVEPGRLVFSFTPGPVVVCVLTQKEDASYAGDCTEDDGSAAQIVLVPPKKES